jgi:hypothetical protein
MKRDLQTCYRGTIEAKETCYRGKRGKRDLLYSQKRPTIEVRDQQTYIRAL